MPSMSPSMSTEKPKVKKPPTCDRCKAKRVLCHPDPRGCPRCLEKGVECTTTPVVRRKPQRKPKGDSLGQPSPEDQLATGSGVASGSTTPLMHQNPRPFIFPSDVAIPSQLHGSGEDQHIALTIDAEALLTPQLLRSMLQDLPRLPIKHHPLLVDQVIHLTDQLKAVNYMFSLLSPPSQAFGAAIAALVSLISIHPAVLGPGPIPASLESLTLQDAAEFATFGQRREPACRALRELALAKAKAGDVLLHATLQNATTCYALDVMLMVHPDRPVMYESRTYISCYSSHMRFLASKGIFKPQARDSVTWSSFLMEEVLLSLYQRSPIVHSVQDELVLRGDSELQGLREILTTFKNSSPTDNILVFTCIKPYSVAVVKIARKLEEHVTGIFAKQRPLDDIPLAEILADMDVMEEIQKLALARLDAMRPPSTMKPFPSLSAVNFVNSGSTKPNKEGIDYMMGCIQQYWHLPLAALVFALYSAMEERGCAIDASSSPAEVRAEERVALLRQQVRTMALSAARRLSVAMDLLPSQSHIVIFWKLRTESWASLLLKEMNATGLPEDVAALASYSRTLKLTTFSYISPGLLSLIADLDMRISISTGFGAGPPLAPLPPLDGMASNALFTAPFLDSQFDLDQWFNAAMVGTGWDQHILPSIEMA